MTAGGADDPGYEIVAVGGDSADNGPVAIGGRRPLPGVGSSVAYDDATQQIHVLGRALAPEAPQAADADGWTVYVIEPHANAVYADARLPAGIEPAAWALDVESDYPAEDREQLLVFGADGRTAVDRDRLARLRVADARGHRRRPDGGVPLPARPDPVRAPARRGPRRRRSRCSMACSSSSRGSA